MKKDLIAQCILESGNKRVECWLPYSKVKVGWSLTLKNHSEPERWWDIIHVGEPMDASSIKSEHDSKAIFEKDFHGKVNKLSTFSK